MQQILVDSAASICANVVARLKRRFPRRIIMAGTTNIQPTTSYVIYYPFEADRPDFHSIVCNLLFINTAFTLDTLDFADSARVWFHIYPRMTDNMVVMTIAWPQTTKGATDDQ